MDYSWVCQNNISVCPSPIEGAISEHVVSHANEDHNQFYRCRTLFGFGGITVPPVNGSEAVAFVSMPLKSIRVVADLAFLHNEQIMHCQMF